MFSYLDNEKHHDTTILLLHGWIESKYHYLPFVSNLQCPYHVIMLDMRGYGLSSAPVTSYSLDEFGEDILKFVDVTLGSGQKLVLAGHSMGGMILTHIINRFENPIQGIIYFNTSSNYHKKNPFAFTVKKALPLISKTNLFSYLVRLAFGIRVRNSVVDIHRKSVTLTPAHVMISSFNNTILEVNQEATIKNMDLPCLIFAGLLDPILTINHASKLKRLYTNSTLFVFPLGGHYSMMEYPETTAKLTCRFIKRLR